MSTIERPLPPLNADERTTLESWLDFHRATLAMTCEGIGDEQGAAASVPPSGLTLTGLVQHMAEVERNWFRRVLAGEQAPSIYDPQADPRGPDGGFELAKGATAMPIWSGNVSTALPAYSAAPQGLEGRVAMLESSHIVAFAAATDLHRARAFYERVLGLTVAEHNDIACVLDANGTMLRVTAVPDVCRAGYTVLGWRVTDITAAVRGLADRGVVFLRYDGMNQDSDGVWTAPGGDKVAWFTDPDGNVLSLTQFR